MAVSLLLKLTIHMVCRTIQLGHGTNLLHGLSVTVKAHLKPPGTEAERVARDEDG